MKKFLVILLTLSVCIGLFSETIPTYDLSPTAVLNGNSAPNRDMWDVLNTFDTSAASHPGVETDGTNIYTAAWNAGTFSRYDMDGTLLGDFTVAGASNIRDMAYDGTYFYGSPASTTISIMDLANETLIGTISVSCAGVTGVRHIAYDPGLDGGNGGFWVGNWNELGAITMSGAQIYANVSPTPQSNYGCAYDPWTAGGPYLWVFSQDGSGAELHQFDIASQSFTGVMHDASDIPGAAVPPMAGGLATYVNDDGLFVMLTNLQQTPNLVGVYEISGTEPSDFDPPQNVIVDDELGILSWDPPSSPLIEDDMESYTVGGYLALQSDLWTTWSNAPGGAEDAFVSDDQSNSGSQSTLVELNQDLVFIMEDYTAGVYSYEMSMYVPSGYCGYFNLQKTSTPGEEWALQIYYQTDGTALGDAAAAGAITHTFNHDEWMDIKVVVDLDNDWATYYFNGDEIFGYQWTLGTFGTPGLLAFGGANIFGGANSTTTDTPMYYFDDVILSEIVPARDLTGYNVYLDNAFVEYTTATTYTYSGLVEDQAYIAGVSAVYDDPGESDVVSVNFVYNPETDFDPPENLTASISDYNTVDLAWEAPGGITAEWIGWDNGENGNAIGLTSGGTFSVASHWDPADLTDYDGAQITQIMFFPNSDARVNFTLKIWTGANAGTEVVSQDVTGFTFNEFNTVEINDTFIIDASTELWFGYEVTHDAGEFPAGCDPGPAVAGYGDMISMDGATWDPLSGFGLDYNWNLQAYLMSSDGQAMTFSNYEKSAPSIKRVNLSNNPFSVIVTESTISRETRSLAGYKIYRDGLEVGEVTDPNVLVFSEEGLDAGTYDYTVTAIYTNPDGESIDSNIAEAVVELPAPINLTATVNMPDVLLQWDDPVRGIEAFKIYRDDEFVGEAVGTAGFYVDANVPNGDHVYNVTAVYTGDFESEYSNDAEATVSGDGILIPLVTELTGNNPNPFNPETSINFSLNKTDNVSIQIYNLKGQLVKTLVDGELNAAWHSIVWNGTDVSDKQVSSGVYFYKMHTSDYTSIKKMILLK